ncbi:MAG TPA: hypothetical protein VGR37_08515 [Longimicrobiaceae bacterium]|nr:hypothetical protein [Longimicrobiaceae bacterium]
MPYRSHTQSDRARRGHGFARAAARDAWLAVEAVLLTAGLSLGLLAAALAALLGAKPRR